MPRYDYPCLTARQRDGADIPEFCSFFAPAGEVLTWAAIERIQEQQGGFQRMANPARVRGVKRFFEQDPRNTIPTAVIVTLRVPTNALTTIPCDGGNVSKRLSFEVAAGIPDTEKPGLVIDGQHRLMGAKQFDTATLVPVVALLNPSQMETAFQFLVINNKAAKVPTDHLRRLALDYDEMGLEHRLRTARLTLKKNYALVGQVDEEQGSPFQAMIRWPTPRPGNRVIVPAAIESALQYIEDQQLQPLKDDTDALLEFFYAIWNAVKAQWADLWETPNAHLLTKVGVVCLTQYLTDSLAKLYEWGEVDLNDITQLSQRTGLLLATQAKQFWAAEWKEGGLDTTAGRQLVIDDLQRMARNLRARLPWFDGMATIIRPGPPPLLEE